MLKVVDLDLQGKEDGYVFVLTIAGEKVGITDQEVTELIKQRYSTSKSAKKAGAKKAQPTDSGLQDNTPAQLGESERESGEPVASEGLSH